MQSDPLAKSRLSRVKVGHEFVFVETTDPHGVGSENRDARARTIIRRQAAKSGHQRGLGRNRNRGGIAAESVSLALLPRERDASRLLHLARGDEYHLPPERTSPHVLSPRPSRQISYNGYETWRVEYNFDITDLATFTDVDLAASAYQSLHRDPGRIAGLLRRPSSSFLDYLPSRFGSSLCVGDAMNCVAARAGEMLGCSRRGVAPAALYVKALRSLNEAIQACGENAISADIYCATRLLVLHESLGLPDRQNLACHKKAGVQFIQRRGPDGHKTGFDRILLRNQGPSIIIGEMHENKASMFEAHAWQYFFKRASDLETDADSRLWWKFFGAVAYLPGILKDTRSLLKTTPPPSEFSARGLSILERAKWVHRRICSDHIFYQHRAPYLPSLFDVPVSTEPPDRIRTRMFFLYPIMYLCRVQATFAPTEIERATSESEAQMFAAQTLLIEKMTGVLDTALVWHLEQRNDLPRSIRQTRGEWVSDMEHGRVWEDLRSLFAWRWQKWEDSWRDGVLSKEL